MTAKELKASILQFAVTGKLVPQDPNDEPASVLLERIKTEKAKLVKVGKIKKDKNPSEIVVGSDGAVYEKFKDGTVKDISDDIPFKIPANWKWSRLTDITEFLHRGKSPVYVPKSRCPMFAQKCNQWDGIHLEKCKFCSETKYRSYPAEYHLRDCDVVINSTGTGTLGRVGLFATNELEQYGFASIIPDSHVTIVRTSDKTLNRFIFHYLRTDLLWKWMNEIADGSTKQKELYTSTLATLLVPIPSRNEQMQIMRKIEELMPLVEKYGELEDHRLRLDASLPNVLEKSILQEAIQGKLVPQNPNDEPASELLKRVTAERKALVKERKLKRDKGKSVIFRGSDRLAYETRNGETVCIQDEIPFNIPDSWEWVRLGSISTIVRGSGIKRSETAGCGFPCIRYGEVYTTYGYFFLKARSFTSEAVAAKCNKAHCGDVLCTLTGECKEEIAKASAYLGEVPIAIGGDLARISNHPYDPVLLAYFMFSPFLLSQKADKSNGDIIVHIGKEAIENLLLPLPPVAEQKRIANRITNLLATIKSFTT